MYQNFQNFYLKVKNIPLYWESLEQTLRIKQDFYPSNQEMYFYYTNTFKGKTSSFGRSKWHRMDKLLCVWMISHYCVLENKNMLELEKVDFRRFSFMLEVESELLEFKWLKLIKPYLKNKPWSQEEDLIINDLMKSKMAKKWTEIALKLSESAAGSGLRTAKQVRERWINYLDPAIKRDDWTKSQDQELFRVAEEHGKKWSVLGKILKRTENSIKNRYHSMLAKIKQQDKNISLYQFKQIIDSKSSYPKKNSFNVSEIQFIVPSLEMKVASFKFLEQKICKYRSLDANEYTSD